MEILIVSTFSIFIISYLAISHNKRELIKLEKSLNENVSLNKNELLEKINDEKKVFNVSYTSLMIYFILEIILLFFSNLLRCF